MLDRIDLSTLRFERIYRAYLGLDSRQQTIALVVAGIVSVLIVTLPFAVARGKLRGLEVQISQSKERVREIARELDKYQTAKARLGRAEKLLAEGFDSSISTTLESLAVQNGIADRIDSLKERPPVPSELMEEVAVDVRLKKVNLPQLIAYLYDIEHQPNKLLRLKRLEIKPRYDDPKQLDVSFQVSTYKISEDVR